MSKLASLCICCLLLFAANNHFWNLATLQDIVEEIIISDAGRLAEDSGTKSPYLTPQIIPELPNESLTEQTRTAPESPNIPSSQDTIVTIIVHPANGSRVRGGSNVSLTFSPAAGCVCYSWNDGEKVHVDNPGALWGIPAPMGDGWKTLEVWANSSTNSFPMTYQRFIFLVDNSVELPSLISPSNNSLVPSWTPITLSMKEPLTLNVSWDGSPNGSLEVPAGNGLHHLQLHLQDEAGNTAIMHFEFVVALNFRLLEYGNGSRLQPGTQIKYELSDAGNLLHSWNGTANQTFTPALPAEDGLYVLDGWAENESGFQIHHRFIFTTDGTPPNITVVSGQRNDDLVEPGELLSIGYTETLHELSISWREDSEYSYFSDSPPTNKVDWLVPNPGGSHHLDLFARDLAGNTASKTYIFHVLVLPRLANPFNNSVVSAGTEIMLQWTDSFGNETAKYSWDGATNSTYLKLVPYGSGYHELAIFCQNQEFIWAKRLYRFQVLVAITHISPRPE